MTINPHTIITQEMRGQWKRDENCICCVGNGDGTVTLLNTAYRGMRLKEELLPLLKKSEEENEQ